MASHKLKHHKIASKFLKCLNKAVDFKAVDLLDHLVPLFLRFYYFDMFASSLGGTQENSENLPDFQPDSAIRGYFRSKIDSGPGKAGGIARRQESYHDKI